MWHWIIDHWYLPVVLGLLWLVATFVCVHHAAEGNPAKMEELTEHLKESLRGKRKP